MPYNRIIEESHVASPSRKSAIIVGQASLGPDQKRRVLCEAFALAPPFLS